MNKNKNVIALLFLLMFINLYFQFLFFPYGLPIFILGETRLAFLLGIALRIFVTVFIYYLLQRYMVEEDSVLKLTESVVKTSKSIRHIDILVLVLIYNILPFILDKVYSLLFENYNFNDPSSGEVDYLVEFIFVVFAAPIVEEIVFRWQFFKIADRFDLGRYDFFTKMSLNVSIFALIHYAFNLQEVFKYTAYMIYIPLWAFFGFISFWIYYNTRSLKLVIFYHMFNNFFIMTLRWFHRVMERNGSDFRIKTEWLIVITVIFIFVLYYSNLPNMIREITSAILSYRLPLFLLIFVLVNGIYLVINYLPFNLLFQTSIALLGIVMFSFAIFYCVLFVKTMNSDVTVQLFTQKAI